MNSFVHLRAFVVQAFSPLGQTMPKSIRPVKQEGVEPRDVNHGAG